MGPVGQANFNGTGMSNPVATDIEVKRLRVFCDFDGTTAVNDVGDLFFQTFAGKDRWQETVDRYIRGEITSKEYLEEICAASHFDPGQFEELLKEQTVDPHFPEFVRYCRQRGYPVTVLSDGLDIYIRRVLEKSGLDDVEFYSNKAVLLDGGVIVPELPYHGIECNECANCKGYHIRRLREDGDFTVFVGDGISDRHGVQAADYIFAKGPLQDWCRENGYDFEPYTTFADVLRGVQRLECRLGLRTEGCDE